MGNFHLSLTIPKMNTNGAIPAHTNQMPAQAYNMPPTAQPGYCVESQQPVVFMGGARETELLLPHIPPALLCPRHRGRMRCQLAPRVLRGMLVHQLLLGAALRGLNRSLGHARAVLCG